MKQTHSIDWLELARNVGVPLGQHGIVACSTEYAIQALELIIGRDRIAEWTREAARDEGTSDLILDVLRLLRSPTAIQTAAEFARTVSDPQDKYGGIRLLREIPCAEALKYVEEFMHVEGLSLATIQIIEKQLWYGTVYLEDPFVRKLLNKFERIDVKKVQEELEGIYESYGDQIADPAA